VLTPSAALPNIYEGELVDIGHMGHMNAHMVLGVLATIEGDLTALDNPMAQPFCSLRLGLSGGA
jgi:predicted alpha/beta hydrolase family esterase